jgi:hypothetical protein
LGMNALSGLIGNQNNDLGGIAPVPAYNLSRGAMSAFQQAAPVPRTLAEAALLVQTHASYCSDVGTQLLSAQASMAAQPVVISPTTAAVAPVTAVAPVAAEVTSKPAVRLHKHSLAKVPTWSPCLFPDSSEDACKLSVPLIGIPQTRPLKE